MKISTAPERRAILVLGMHRSGTSVLASILQAIGVELGPSEALLSPSADAANETNVKGFFELRDVVDIHDSLLLELGMQWDCVGALPERWLESRAAAHAEEALLGVLERRFARALVWGVKDPRMCRFVPLWTRILARVGVAPTLVVASRDPRSVAASLYRRDGLSTSHALELWYTYMSDALAHVDPMAVIVVSYDLLVADPLVELERLSRWLRLGGDADIAMVRGQIEALVDPGMRHHAPGETALLPDCIRELHEALEVAGASPSGGMPALDARSWRDRRPGMYAYVGEVERRCLNVAIGPWCQIFYRDAEEEFREDRSERIPLRGSRGGKGFTSIIVCKYHATTVRIDPMNCPGLVWDLTVQLGRSIGGRYGRIRDDTFHVYGGVVLGDGRYLFVGRDSRVEIEGLHADPGDLLVISFSYELLSEDEVVARLRMELGAMAADTGEAISQLAVAQSTLNQLSARAVGLEEELERAKERESGFRGEVTQQSQALMECRAQTVSLQERLAELEREVEWANVRESQLREEMARESQALMECRAHVLTLDEKRAALEARVGELLTRSACSITAQRGEAAVVSNCGISSVGIDRETPALGALARLRARVGRVPAGVVRSVDLGLADVDMLTPLISVVMPSYNHEGFVESAIRSVMAQTYPRVELIVIDDGSTDRTAEVVEKVLATGNLERCELIRQLNGGAHAAINRGLSVARGEVVAILNSDDIYAERRLEAMWAALSAARKGFAFSTVRHVDGSGRALDEQHPYKFGYDSSWRARESFPSLGFLLLLYNLSVSTGNFVMTRRVSETVGEFRPFRIVHDWDYLLRVLTVCEPLVVDEPLLDYRIHGSNTVSAGATIGRDEGITVIREYRERADVETFKNDMAPCAANWPGYYRWFVERYRLP